ncbi:hypothetical protein ASPCADRAFT_211438 [Aspergillus carbonarius ITEM 5010]|uniref:Uncharacterized protein n=1 Tax=Aspergillus carbonarius (strain ITEM 5010) TaxID=602072 RepID=A0A1R3R9I9_ASPC5|nr:hypothetical protein ASPCADRAFT_211438 [Aspergillus carbonarius ITEM 5010]
MFSSPAKRFEIRLVWVSLPPSPLFPSPPLSSPLLSSPSSIPAFTPSSFSDCPLQCFSKARCIVICDEDGGEGRGMNY